MRKMDGMVREGMWKARLEKVVLDGHFFVLACMQIHAELGHDLDSSCTLLRYDAFSYSIYSLLSSQGPFLVALQSTLFIKAFSDGRA